MLFSQMKANVLSEEQIDEILFSERCDKVVKSDYAILLGTDPKHATFRAEIAASFYTKGGARTIVASGAAVSDKSIPESTFLHQELVKLGVPEEAIIEETRAYDTIQNMVFSLAEICKREDVTQVKSVTVITEPFHMRRALCLANVLLPKFLKIYGYTEGIARQREAWKDDERLKNCVNNEILILRQLIAKGLIEDIRL